MKKELGPIVIVVAVIVLAVGIGTTIYLFVRPEPVNVRKGVPWEGREKRMGTPPGGSLPAPPH